MTPSDQALRHRYEVAGIPLHKIPFSLWYEKEFVAYLERTTDTHVMIRWPKGSARQGQAGVGPVAELLQKVAPDVLDGATIFPVSADLAEVMKRL